MANEHHRARKELGQHFLHDRNVIDNIVRAIAPKADDRLVEIGPGLGALTTVLLPLAQRLDVIEIDDDVIAPLKKNCSGLGELTIHHQDVLTFDFNQFDSSIRLVGNLPYNISSPLIFHVLNAIDNIIDMHFMLQKEVVDRICAKPGNKTYGRLSIMVQYFCHVDSLFVVKPGSFRPPPKVDSAVVRLIPKNPNERDRVDLKTLSHVVKTAFSMRRKTLKNNLKPLLNSDQLEKIGIAPSRRPEELTVDEFVRIAQWVKKGIE